MIEIFNSDPCYDDALVKAGIGRRQDYTGNK